MIGHFALKLRAIVVTSLLPELRRAVVMLSRLQVTSDGTEVVCRILSDTAV